MYLLQKYLLLSVCLFSFTSACKSQTVISHIKRVAAITEVFGDGQKVTAAAVEFDKAVKNSTLSPNDFSVAGRTVTKIYSNRAAEKSSYGVDGKYVLIELGVTDKNAATFIQQGRQAVIKEASVSVRQLENIKTADGENNYKPTGDAVTSDTQINLVVDNFKQLEYKDAATGKKLSYNLFTPENYDPTKRYPLVLFIHDAGATGTNTKTTLVQGLGAVVWATPSEQAKHACFVLAPQYSNAIVNDQSEITEEGDITVRLLKSITSQYSIDTNRLYATGQSMGCMASIALNIQYPDLFAASLLVAGQWDAAKVAPMAKDKLWIIVSEGDLKAFPGMNAITAALEKDGAKVSRATWSGKSTAAEFATAVSTMIAQGNNIHYTVLKKGTVVPAGMTDDGGSNHICIWWIAYNIEGVRDWLFMQAKK